MAHRLLGIGFGLCLPAVALAGPLSGYTAFGEMGIDSVDATGLSNASWVSQISATGVVGAGVENPLIMPYVYGDFSNTDAELTVAVNTSWAAMAFNGLRFTLTDRGAPLLADARLIATDIPGFGVDRIAAARTRVAFNFQGMSSVGYVTVGFDLPALDVAGACPGRAQLDLSGYTPHGDILLVRGASTGATPIPAGPCAGTMLGMARPSLVRTLTANQAGEVSLTPNLPRQACGGVVEAVDLTTCTVSGVVALP